MDVEQLQEGARSGRVESSKLPPSSPSANYGTVTVRLGRDIAEQLKALADARNMTTSAMVRTAVEMYLHRESFAVGLSNMEANIAVSIEAARAETSTVRDDIQMLFGLIDTLMEFSFSATPEVIDKPGAYALGKVRYAGFLSEIHKKFKNRNKRSKLHIKLKELTSEDLDG